MTGVVAERLRENRISLTGWVGPSTPKKCKAVGAGRFVPKTAEDEAYWSYPLTLATCRAIRAQFGDALTIGPALNRWAHEAIKEERHSEALSLAEDAVLTRIPGCAPKIDAATASRPYQRVAAAWGAVTGSFILADEQGLGKSIETLATIIEAADKPQWHLVMSPSVAVDTVWAAEAERWVAADQNVIVLPLVGTLAEREALLASLKPSADVRHVFVVANIESARIKPVYDEVKDPKHRRPKYLTENAVLPSLHGRIWDTMVVDECQRALIRTSGTPTQTRAGFSVLSRNANRRIALSGTPMRGKPENLWGTLNWLRPDVYTSYWNWVKNYWTLLSDDYSDHILGDFLPDGEERLGHDLRHIMLRRTKAEVLPQLPPKQYAGTYLIPSDEMSPYGTWLEPLPAQIKQMKALMEEGGIDFADDGEVLVNGVLAEYTRNKQLANAVYELKGGVMVPTLESPKYQWLLNWLSEADGAKVVVASQFTSIIDVFAAGLRAEGYSVAVLTGKTAMGKRRAMVEQFQDTDEVQVFMLNTKAGGVALTLDAADFMVILDETSIPDDQEQVEDRIHRTSRIHNVTVYYLRTRASIDEEIAWVTAARARGIKFILDGVRGVSTAKRLYEEGKEKQESNHG